MGFALSDIHLQSPSFTQDGVIPTKHTGEGDDLSPALSWSNPPEGTKSFAVLCHDPDAPLVTPKGNYGFVHWVYYNIPGTTTDLKENCDQYTHGNNDFGNQSYGGPMPPNGHGQHNYYFWILAFDKEMNLDAGLSMYDFLASTEQNLLGMNRLLGKYKRD